MIKVLNASGTKVYVLDKPSVPWVDCFDALSAIQGGALIDCPQSLGDLSETRASSGYSCLSSNESTTSMGAVSRASLDIGMLLNPDDQAGQLKVRRAFLNNTPLIMAVELPTITYYFDIYVSAIATGVAMDSAITYNVTVEISSSIKECNNSLLIAKDCALSVGGITADQFNLPGFWYRNCNIFK